MEVITALEPSKSIGAFPDVPDLETSGEEAYVYFHIDPTHTNFINRIIEGYEYLGVMTSVDYKWAVHVALYTIYAVIGY